ncbi:MAG: hypothetical protein IJM51_03990 [Clostridia bacterium]|nr:hypothetical protein [Clostridia bacterium]
MSFSNVLTDIAGLYETRDFRLRRNNFPYSEAVTYIVAFSLLLRLIIAVSYLNSYDTEWNIMWGVQLSEGFFSAHSHVNELDYPPLYLYPLYVVGKLIKVRSIGGYPPLRMLAIKFLPCLADSLTEVVLYRLASKRNRLLGLLAALLWALNPAGIFNCACWGQTDCVLMCMAALLMLALQEGHVAASGILWAAMCSTKLQGLYLTPVVGMEVLTVCFGSLHPREFSFRKIRKPAVMRFVKFLSAAALTLAVIYLPFMFGSAFSDYESELGFSEKFFKPITVYSGGLAKYPYVTMNADNIYMLCGLNGIKDKVRILPGISVSAIGTFFLLMAMAAVVAVYIFGKRRSHWLAGFMFMESVFMLTCRQHERYQIVTLVLLMGAFVTVADRRLLTVFNLNSFVIFFNQFRVLSTVRERTDWWRYYRYANGSPEWLDRRRSFAAVNSLLNVILFIASMILVMRFFFDGEFGKPTVSRILDLSFRKGEYDESKE